jgi:hypothetical protein
MPSLELAHIREQGQDMLIFPLDDSFGRKTESDRAAMLTMLERRAHAAGLAGGAVAIWEHGSHTHFMGPRPWRPFLEGIDMDWVWANVNREISWTN